MTQNELNIGAKAVRALLTEFGYSNFVTDQQCEQAAYAVIEAVDDYRKAKASKQGTEPA